MKLSIIIPIYNESASIGQCMDMLDRLNGEFEVLFADGGSTDDTVARIGTRFPVLPCPKGRANQMNHAAKSSHGDVLWFVHCDSDLPDDGPRQIMEAVKTGTKFGCFQIKFDQPGFWMACNRFFSNFRARFWKVAFGDQGIFIKAETFQEIGGFPDLPIMEDLELSRICKRKKIPLHQIHGSIVTSARRYQGKHPLKTMWQMFLLRCRYRLGDDIQSIASSYKDIR